LYVGYAPHCAAEVLGRGVYFVAYEYMKRNLTERRQRQHASNNDNDNDTTTTTTTALLGDRMVSAACAGMLCWALIFPLDALRCRLYVASADGGRTATTTARQMARYIHHQKGGWRTFYRGFGVTI
jgi:hypothetical protein